MAKICEWADGEQRERDATPDELAEIESRRTAGPSSEMLNAPILAALSEIDRKSIRALREGNTVRIAELEQQAAALRNQLKK